MHYAVGRLIGIEMNHFHSVEHFISKWKDILQRLENQGEVSWKTLLWVFLLRACNSHAFTDVCHYMIKNPCMEQDDYIRELRSKASMQKMLNDESPMGLDGQVVSRCTAKTTHPSKNVSWKKGTHSQSFRNTEEEKFVANCWSIPPFPDGYDQCIAPKVYKGLLQWRKSANGSSTPVDKLNHNHAVRKRLNTMHPNWKNRRAQANNKDCPEDDRAVHPNKKPRKEYRIESAFPAPF